MLQRFLPLLAMTFFICLFIVLMQFLWRYIEDLVGKGLTFDVIAELFFYAALTMVPTALPLAVLLASLMTFGNLGEKFELTAMKAAGISLFRIMRPLMVLMAFIAVGAFFFQNNVLPVGQTKMWTILFSVRQKSPEVEIPERSFYDQIPNMNLYVEHKNPDTGMLYGMIIYDTSRGLDNTRVILADSGRFNFTEDKTRLLMRLYSGEMFENMRDNSMGASSSRYMPFRREAFTEKNVYFPFDMNFNRMDESGMRSQYIGQNISQLRHSIDSLGHRVDSVSSVYAREITSQAYFGLTPTVRTYRHGEVVDEYISQALVKARRQQQEYNYKSLALADQAKLMRRHDIEMQRKFTLSFACIIFFFIGAPLGAIIKKGGLGTPLIISVLLFIVYFIIDNTGYKMARDGKLEVWQGIWLSSAALLPLGIFFTYKAVGDSAVFNVDAYTAFIRRITGRTLGRSLTLKEVRMADVEPSEALTMLREFDARCAGIENSINRLGPVRRLFKAQVLTRPLARDLNALVEYLSNTTDIYVINLLNQYPFATTPRRLRAIRATDEALIKLISRKSGDTTYGTEQ